MPARIQRLSAYSLSAASSKQVGSGGGGIDEKSIAKLAKVILARFGMSRVDTALGVAGSLGWITFGVLVTVLLAVIVGELVNFMEASTAAVCAAMSMTGTGAASSPAAMTEFKSLRLGILKNQLSSSFFRVGDIDLSRSMKIRSL